MKNAQPGFLCILVNAYYTTTYVNESEVASVQWKDQSLATEGGQKASYRLNSEQRAMVQNGLILGHSKLHFPTSKGMSEQTGERSGAREQCGASERVSGASQRAS